jgi:hypothetical protein
LLVYIFNPNVFFAVVSCCAHGVFVPPVLLFELVVLSLSRLIKEFTNGLSIADILLLYQSAERLRITLVKVGRRDHERMG